jgi:hypothetical protein
MEASYPPSQHQKQRGRCDGLDAVRLPRPALRPPLRPLADGGTNQGGLSPGSGLYSSTSRL